MSNINDNTNGFDQENTNGQNIENENISDAGASPVNNINNESAPEMPMSSEDKKEYNVPKEEEPGERTMLFFSNASDLDLGGSKEPAAQSAPEPVAAQAVGMNEAPEAVKESENIGASEPIAAVPETAPEMTPEARPTEAAAESVPVTKPAEDRLIYTNGPNYAEKAPSADSTVYTYPNRAPEADKSASYGERASIRYDRDENSSDGNYTWKYEQNELPAKPVKKKKKHTALKVVSICLASAVMIGAIVAAVIFILPMFRKDKSVKDEDEKHVEVNANDPDNEPDNSSKSDPDNSGSSASDNGNKNDKADKNISGNKKSPATSKLPKKNDEGKETAADAQTSVEETVIFSESEGGDVLSKQEIAAKCKPSSVGIQVVSTARGWFGGTYQVDGVGSGFILTEDGYIATNCHVIEGAEKITVMLDDGTKYEAELIGADSITDLAVIKIEAEGLIPLEMGDSDLMKVGDSVVAIGTPAGIEFAGTVTDGIISAINRDVEVQGSNGATKKMTLMQTNAAINPGNSGGPLINSKGQVVGINTLKLTERFEGIGFSIPINSAKKVFNQLIKDGKVTDYDDSFVSGNGAIGITNYVEVSKAEAEYYDLPEGIMVIQLKSGCNSQKAGLKRGDIITKFNGKRVKTVAELNERKASFKAGDEVTLTVYRDEEEEIDITFKLDIMG